ncbi:hypothetical protein CA163_27645, partial [Vibrio parahaemolyticus]
DAINTTANSTKLSCNFPDIVRFIHKLLTTMSLKYNDICVNVKSMYQNAFKNEAFFAIDKRIQRQRLATWQS